MNLPPGFTHRIPAIEDVAAVVDLINTCTQTDFGRATTSIERITGYWSGYSQTNDTSPGGAQDLVFAPDATLAAYIETEWNEARQYFFFMLYIHPGQRSNTLYATLRTGIEGRAALWVGAVTVRENPYSVLTNVWEQETVAREQLESADYVLIRFQRRLERRLDEPPPVPTLPPALRIHPYRPGQDDSKIHAAWLEAMANDWSAPDLSLEQFLTTRVASVKEFDPDLWFFMWDGDEIAGFALTQWERPGDPDAGYIRDVGVRRAWRRRGVGLALLYTAFNEFYCRGKRRVSLTVDGMNPNGATQLYEKAGMYSDLKMLTYAKSLA